MFAVADDGGGPALVLELKLADFVVGSERGGRFWGFAADIVEVQVRVRAHWGGCGRGLAWLGTGRKSQESSLYGETVEA